MDDMDTGVSEDEGFDHQDGGDSEGSDVPEWLQGADPEQVEFAKNIGALEDPTRALKAAMGAEQSRRASQSERDELKSMMDQMLQAQANQGPAAPQQPEPQDEMFQPGAPPDLDALATAFGGNEAAAIDFIAQTRAQEAAEFAVRRALEEIRGEIAPVSSFAEQAQMQQAAAELAQTYGETYNELAPQVASFIQQNPDFNSARGMWQAFGLVAAHTQQQQRVTEQRKAAGDDIGGGGSRGGAMPNAQADAAKSILSAIENASGSRKPGYGGL